VRTNYRHCKNAHSFLEICDAFGILQHVREATRCNCHSLVLVLSKDVSIPEVLVCNLTPSDHYYVSFTNAASSVRETAVTLRRALQSINRFDQLSSLKYSGLLCLFPHTSGKSDEPVASINADLRKAVDAVAPLRPQRPKARDHSFLFSKKLEKLRRKKNKLERRYRKTRFPADTRIYKTFLINTSPFCERASPRSSIRS